jgi:hypothetical protein
MKSFYRLFFVSLIMIKWGESSPSQTPSPLSFYPYRAGNVWQYRDSFNNEVFYTRFNDRDSVDAEGNIFLSGRDRAGTFLEKIDTLANVFNLLSGNPNNPLYRLRADTGHSWIGWRNDIRITLVSVGPATIFGRSTTLKRFRFTLVPPPPGQPLVFREDYLASGFGLVQAFYEPNLFLYLGGAIIDSIRWGILVGAREDHHSDFRFAIHQNYPNPFNPVTTIRFDLPQANYVRLTVFDMIGRRVRVLEDGEMGRGSHIAVFNAMGLASGVYYYRIEVGPITQTKRMIVQK